MIYVIDKGRVIDQGKHDELLKVSKTYKHKTFGTILRNAGIDDISLPTSNGKGINVVTGKTVSMVKSGIIDPLLVTKSALKNAASVATTILSTDCVINNLRA